MSMDTQAEQPPQINTEQPTEVSPLGEISQEMVDYLKDEKLGSTRLLAFADVAADLQAHYDVLRTKDALILIKENDPRASADLQIAAATQAAIRETVRNRGLMLAGYTDEARDISGNFVGRLTKALDTSDTGEQPYYNTFS